MKDYCACVLLAISNAVTQLACGSI